MNNSSNSQPWMMGTEYSNNNNEYMLSRVNGSVLPPIPAYQGSPQSIRQTTSKQDEQGSISSVEYEQPISNNKSKSNRSVIPSKRAAQNRAAQKAFRQRREQYIKDLEIKAKEMEDWQTEIDNLRKENKELRDRVIELENQVHVFTGGETNKLTTLENLEERPAIKRTLRQEVSPIQKDKEKAFAPVPLRAPNQTGFEQSSCFVNGETKGGKIEEQPPPIQKVNLIQPQQQLSLWDNHEIPPQQGIPEFDLDFDFDPFFEDEFGPTFANNNDFLPNANSNQVLDDLFAMLQTRQRPQIPIIPSEDTSDIA